MNDDSFIAPIVVGPTKVDNICVIETTNWPLIDVQMVQDPRIDHETNVVGISFDSNVPAMRIKMPCGEEIIFNKFLDIPEHTVMCPCGNPKHTAWEYRA